MNSTAFAIVPTITGTQIFLKSIFVKLDFLSALVTEEVLKAFVLSIFLVGLPIGGPVFVRNLRVDVFKKK